jgi:diguanylate cyclase (GGDEF)-like protein/PAS domain S-box-containing protein
LKKEHKMDVLNSLKTNGKGIFKVIPFHLWLVITVSFVIPFLTNILLQVETPLVIYLLFLIPIFIFAFYLNMKQMLLSIAVFSLLHSICGVLYQYQIGGMEDVDIRLFNHLGFTFISFSFALLIGSLLKEVKESDFRYRSVVEYSPQLIIILQNGLITFANKSAMEIAGVRQLSDIIGKPIIEFIHPTNIEKVHKRNKEILENKAGNKYNEYSIIRPDGKLLHIEILGNVINYKGQPAILVMGNDVTAKKEYQEKMEYMAYHDSLTGLPNRYLLDKYLEEAIQKCAKTNQELSIMLIDLDRFKFINDTLGHKLGDSLLIQVSERLKKSVRENDIVARQGGDEFLVLLKNTNLSIVKNLAEGIINSFTSPFNLEGDEFITSPSIGISVYPKDGHDKETLTRHADTAMYMAKKRGKNNFQFYNNEKEEIRQRNNKLEQGLKRALVNKEFQLHYQPKVILKTGKIFCVEALLRWTHPELGEIPPTEFIPIAEESGMIIPIGSWVLHEACKQNKLWQESGIDISVAVNVSTIQFEDPRFIEIVKDALFNSQLAPGNLILELTESVMQNITNSNTIINTLKSLGVKIAIDDFGTGYSSLNVLNKLTIDLVKIDKSFVNEITSSTNSASLVKTMIEIGENLQFDLIAEGIENKQQADFLIQNDCRFGQGYLYSPPLPAGEVESLLLKQYIIRETG